MERINYDFFKKRRSLKNKIRLIQALSPDVGERQHPNEMPTHSYLKSAFSCYFLRYAENIKLITIIYENLRPIKINASGSHGFFFLVHDLSTHYL